jgi:hypothetical protein
MALVHPDPGQVSPDRPLTPGEALAKLFMDNADRGANAANADLVEAPKQRIRAFADQWMVGLLKHGNPAGPLRQQRPDPIQRV